MGKLKEAYNIKKDILINGDMHALETILRQNPLINSININSDNTIYVESNEGVDVIKKTVESEMLGWFRSITVPANMILNTLPISGNSCILRI